MYRYCLCNCLHVYPCAYVLNLSIIIIMSYTDRCYIHIMCSTYCKLARSLAHSGAYMCTNGDKHDASEHGLALA